MVSIFVRRVTFLQTPFIFQREVVCQSIKTICLSTKKTFSSRAAVEDAITPITESAKNENQRIRMNLALSYRLLNRLDLNEGVCNHLTAMAPTKDNSSVQTMLVVPGNIFVEQLHPDIFWEEFYK